MVIFVDLGIAWKFWEFLAHFPLMSTCFLNLIYTATCPSCFNTIMSNRWHVEGPWHEKWIKNYDRLIMKTWGSRDNCQNITPIIHFWLLFCVERNKILFMINITQLTINLYAKNILKGDLSIWTGKNFDWFFYLFSI